MTPDRSSVGASRLQAPAVSTSSGPRDHIRQLSVALAGLLLLTALILLLVPTWVEYGRALTLGQERTGFAAAAYAERLGTLLDKGDHLAASAARVTQEIPDSPGYQALSTSLRRELRWSGPLAGYLVLSADGTIIEYGFKDHTGPSGLAVADILARNRDHWMGPVVRPAQSQGGWQGRLAVERGFWSEEGAFLGVGVAYVALEAALQDTALDKLFATAHMQLYTMDGALVYDHQGYDAPLEQVWLDSATQKAVLTLKDPAGGNGLASARYGTLFLASQTVPGFPLRVTVQIPEDTFLEHIKHGLLVAILVTAVVVAMAGLIVVMIFRDRTAQRSAQTELHHAEERLQYALYAGGLALWEWWPQTGKVHYSERILTMLGYRPDSWPPVARAFLRHVHRPDLRTLLESGQRVLSGDLIRCRADFRMRRADGMVVWYRAEGRVVEWTPDGRPKRVIGVNHDVSAEKGRELELAFAATHDPLLGLLNRQALAETFRRFRARAERHGTAIHMVMFDIDHFKRVNDTWGHDVGDIVLKAVAETVRGALRTEEQDCFFRVGGEEFVLLFSGFSGGEVSAAAERMRLAIAGRQISFGTGSLTVTASFGVAAFDARDPSLDRLMKRADEALYAAKAGGRNQVVTTCGP